MTYFIKRFALLLIALITLGCSKDDDGGNQNSPTPKLVRFSNDTENYQISYENSGKPQAIINSNNAITPIIFAEDKLTSFSNNSYTYDSNGRLETITNDEGSCTLIYNIQNQLTRQDIVILHSLTGNPILTIQRNLIYNTENQLTEVTETNSDNSNIEKYTLTYNNEGQVVRVVNSYTNGTNSSYIVRQDVDLIYHTSINPLYELYNQIGMNTNVTWVDLQDLNPSYWVTIGISNYVYFRLYYINENNLSNIDITAYSNNSSETLTYSFNYLLESDYPIAADMIRTYNNSSSTYQFFWEYSNL
ncbi:hypothetical protein [Winogradskyella sp. SYSU M77433]|uniref:hypothetical protein n=1 Tax=Winogradskyella sp. SYSU M77433 TaxID=3042722 RepID=UPI00248145A3|nr:hypothetical protein [Winogradskyella sp. SYSU M77433]MDH7913421.1 hypothetical protein [Winogradskyella sp. SYSU M77433]